MNKKEVSDFLGRSTRLIEKYASEGKLGEVTYVRGRTGDQAEYNRDSVERFKAELESPASSSSATTPEQDYLGDLRGLLRNLTEEPRSAFVPVSEKLLLDITECRLLTGLSNSLLRKAVDAGTLKAKIIGRSYKIKRQDLEDFIDKLGVNLFTDRFI